MEAAEIIQKLQLQKHPEGGYFREIYKSDDVLKSGFLPRRYSGARPAGTSIYYLLAPPDFSAFHRLQSDEIWHFYLGGPLRIYELIPGEDLKVTILGQSITEKQQLQYVVRRGHWFSVEPASADGFSLVGCTVAPGFDFGDFEMGKRDALVNEFPEQVALIERLTSK